VALVEGELWAPGLAAAGAAGMPRRWRAWLTVKFEQPISAAMALSVFVQSTPAKSYLRWRGMR
jgi:hypothetical protein